MLNTFKKIFSIILLLNSFNANAEIIFFENVNVVPMIKNEVLKNHRIIVDGNKIVAIEPMTVKQNIKADKIVDCEKKYVIPGLVDTHYHQDGSDPENYKLLYKLLLANGITSIVSMGEFKDQDTISIRENANRPDVLAPIYFTVGPFLDAGKLKSPADAIEMVNYHKKRGYDFIKVHGDFSQETYLSLLEAAEKNGIPVIGHAQRNLPLEYTLRLTHIAHMEEIVMIFSDASKFYVPSISDAKAKEIATEVKNSGVYVSPTLSILGMIQDYTNDIRFENLKNRPETKYLSANIYKNYTAPNKEYRREVFLSQKGLAFVDALVKNTKKLTKAFYKAGVPMLVGSDNFGMQVAGFSFHDEMEKMSDAGLPAYEILNAATIRSARYLKRQAISGSIEVGKNAEFVLLSDNPLNNIKNTRDVQGVMIKGQWIDKKAIDQFLIDVEIARNLEKNK